MGTIASNNIQIFPLAKPRATNLSNRLFYENNVAAIIRQITSNKSFIVDATTPTERATAIKSVDSNIITIQGYNASNDYALEFNIYGYRIQIQNGTIISVDNINSKYLIGKLKVTDPNDANLTEIDGQDVSGSFSGFEIISSDSEITDTTTEKYLILFEKDESDNSKYNMYEKSLQLFTSKSIDITGMITGIDGKRQWIKS